MMDLKAKRDMLTAINTPSVFDPIAKEAFQTVDSDNSGSIDRAEFDVCVKQVAEGFGFEIGQEKIDELYSSLDSDNNGTIDYDEFKKYIKQIMNDLIENL